MLTKEQNRILEAIGISQLQNILVIFKSLAKITSTLNELEEIIREYITVTFEEFKVENDRMIAEMTAKTPKCPKCGTPMQIQPASRIEGYLSAWVCRKCGSICLSQDTIDVELRKYGMLPSRVRRIPRAERAKAFAEVEWGRKKP